MVCDELITDHYNEPTNIWCVFFFVESLPIVSFRAERVCVPVFGSFAAHKKGLPREATSHIQARALFVSLSLDLSLFDEKYSAKQVKPCRMYLVEEKRHSMWLVGMVIFLLFKGG